MDTHIGKYWTGNIVYLSTRPFPAFCVLAEKDASWRGKGKKWGNGNGNTKNEIRTRNNFKINK